MLQVSTINSTFIMLNGNDFVVLQPDIYISKSYLVSSFYTYNNDFLRY